MRAFLEEIQATIDSGIWSTALASALVVPDACGAVEYPGATGNRDRYVSWYDNFVERFGGFHFNLDGAFVWKIRNGMLHEAGTQFYEYGFERVFFTVPTVRGSRFDGITHQETPESPPTLGLSLDRFVARILRGAEAWLCSIADDQEKQGKLDRLIQFRPDGLAPVIVGVPVIG